MNFSDLVGNEFDFYGVSNHDFKLGDTVYRALEDEEDGYRSLLSDIEVITSKDSGPFFQTPIARVGVFTTDHHEYTENFVGYELVDMSDGHVWLIIGTDRNDDYYPMFMFVYSPKNP